MARYRNHLPQLADQLFLTDGGLETTLIFHEGIYLPEFAAFDLLKDAFGYQVLHKYFRTYASLAQSFGVGCILESATWRASMDWGEKLGYSRHAIAELNHKSIDLLHHIRQEYGDPHHSDCHQRLHWSPRRRLQPHRANGYQRSRKLSQVSGGNL
jgi:S-methylmethionine-dependent homocysteine/selenocysteine methylase